MESQINEIFFQLCEHSLPITVSENFGHIFHEFLSCVHQLASQSRSFEHYSIKSIVNTDHVIGKKYPVVIEELHACIDAGKFVIITDPVDKLYNLDTHQQIKFFVDKNKDNIHSKLIFVYYDLIIKINKYISSTNRISTITKEFVSNVHDEIIASVQNIRPNVQNKQEHSIGELLSSTSNIINDIIETQHKLNTESLIESLNENDEEKCSEYIKITKIRDDIIINDDIVCENIRQLEKADELLMKHIEEEYKTLEDEKNTLVNYSCDVRYNDNLKKITDERQNQIKNVYLSEKDYTYPMIYKQFEKNDFDWTVIPPLFISKFPVYLFMDGKDHYGKDVRDKLYNIENEFTIFELLLDAITDDDFNMPDNKDHIKIVKSFLDNLPPIDVITPAEIMITLNAKSDNPIFLEAECDKNDQEDNYEDDVNNDMPIRSSGLYGL